SARPAWALTPSRSGEDVPGRSRYLPLGRARLRGQAGPRSLSPAAGENGGPACGEMTGIPHAEARAVPRGLGGEGGGPGTVAAEVVVIPDAAERPGCRTGDADR